jgi:hypothetical protein
MTGTGQSGEMPEPDRHADEVLAAAVRQVGLEPTMFAPTGSSRGRTGYRAPDLGLFARIDGLDHAERVHHEVRFANWALSRSLPTLGLDPRYLAQPIVTASGLVTFWPLALPVATSDIDPSSFGQALRRLHSVTDMSAPSAWKPASALRAALDDLRRKLSAGSVALAASEVDRVLAWLDGPGSALATGVIHGDASPDNAVLLDGTMVLIDFELAGVGPIAYDLSPVRVLARRFDLPAEFAAATIASSGVSIDPRSQAMLDRLFELTIILGVIGLYVDRSAFMDEFELRISSLDDTGARWTPHRQLLLA